MIEGNAHYGVKVYDRVALFGKEKDRVSSNINFAVSGDGWFKYTVADLKEGTWQVKKDGNVLCEVVATKDGGVGSFEAGTGSFELLYLGSYGEKVFTSTPFEQIEGINLKLEPDNKYIYSDVEPFTINGRTLVPLRAIFEALDANVTWDELTATATGEKNGTVIKITENSTIAYVNDKEVILDSPAIIKNGRFLVPVRFVAESFGIKVNWDDFSKTVIIMTSDNTNGNILTYNGEFKPYSGVENALTVYSVKQIKDDTSGNYIDRVVDGSLTSNWAFKEAEDGTAGWGVYDLGIIRTIDSVNIAFMMGDSRSYKFSVYVSENDKDYTLVKDKLTSSGNSLKLETFDLGGVKARYVKIVGFGNTVNNWNNYGEVIFTGK